jgi:bleomycin hydrolase
MSNLFCWQDPQDRVHPGPAVACCLLAALMWTALLAVFPTRAAADTGLDPAFCTELQKTAFVGPHRALADIIAGTNVKDIALNRQRYLEHRPLVNHRIDSGSITHQKSSGRCWMFAGFNVLRPEVIRKYDLKDFEFSQNYLLFWDKLEKANVYLEEMIARAEDPLDDRRLAIVLDSPVGDGGWWSYFVDLAGKYGVIPKEVMPETHNSSSTGPMNRVLRMKLAEMGLDLRARTRDGLSRPALTEVKQAHLREIYRLLALHLGTPPASFTWRYETKKDSTGSTTYPRPLTPKSFFTDIVDVDLSRYHSLFHYPGKAYDQTYQFEMSRNIYDRPDFTLLNVPIDTLKACALAALLDSAAVWFACDVGQENYGKDGIFALDIFNYAEIYGTTFDLPKQDLIRLGLITPNHAMTFVGVDTVATPAGPRATKWLVENSWGSDAGNKGMWYMYDDWFDRYMFGVIVHEKHLSPRLRELATLPPVLLPPWDPMYGLTKLP